MQPDVPVWDHLIYAYMIENTRIYEVFSRVVEEYMHGEKLGVPSEESQRWLRDDRGALLQRRPAFQSSTR